MAPTHLVKTTISQSRRGSRASRKRERLARFTGAKQESGTTPSPPAAPSSRSSLSRRSGTLLCNRSERCERGAAGAAESKPELASQKRPGRGMEGRPDSASSSLSATLLQGTRHARARNDRLRRQEAHCGRRSSMWSCGATLFQVQPPTGRLVKFARIARWTIRRARRFSVTRTPRASESSRAGSE